MTERGRNWRFTSDIVIVGGCGHVGLPLAVAFADRGAKVVIHDISDRAIESVNAGRVPFREPATGGRVRLRSALADGARITGDFWEVRTDWFSPAASYANFVVLVPAPPGFKRYPTVASVRRTFGQPSRIYYLNKYTVLVWNKNLLADLVPGGPLPPRTSQGTSPATPLPAPPGP